mmetsp:Transcript_6028/g.14877  ORF Transcript_6028/g.14877 Transcript_6028/m.14877 type:complete len:126 (-) Transcript_6028:227-604(-)
MVTVTLQRVHFGHDGPDLCRYDDLSSKDKVSKVQGQVNEVTGIMERNVQQMTENIQAQEVLLDKVESMRSEASTFSKRSSALKRKAFWRNIKLYVYLAVFLVVLLAAFLISFCTFYWECFDDDDD